MFSGLVREFAYIKSYTNQILCLESNLNPNLGDSICVNGACLSAIESAKKYFCVELSDTTAQSIAIENLKGFVHIEPALKMKDGLHGHIVQGHIDCIGRIIDIKSYGNQYIFCIEVDEKTIDFMIPKGSVCVDGISLTINNVNSNSFELIIIPHTMQNTLFNSYKIGRRVNIETDIIVRSISIMLNKYLNSHDIVNIKQKYLTQEICDSITLGY